MNIEEHVDYILNEMKKVPVGKKFKVSDLYKKYEWDQIRVGDRLTIGTKVKAKILEVPNNDISIEEKTTSNQQLYRRNK
ncbi:DUF1413 domain-containing protein [Cetobacterium sp. ZWU0022]|uniref:DUF1413 domain-containing protein n=1 Tax=Cetobacterium sp. ZWU0022 TaxID=1340502 RepID=UPI0006488D5A|nr:DUF1413 domain-containing protein [Cetobacterium sp. ZWU0022]